MDACMLGEEREYRAGFSGLFSRNALCYFCWVSLTYSIESRSGVKFLNPCFDRLVQAIGNHFKMQKCLLIGCS